MNLPEDLKGKKIKEAEMQTDLGASEILSLVFTDGRILKVSASGCPEFGYALQLKMVNLKYANCQHCNHSVESTKKRCPNCKRKPFNQFTTFKER
jgi:Zn finger protein HypA/HybF involved in hydrogenase expression